MRLNVPLFLPLYNCALPKRRISPLPACYGKTSSLFFDYAVSTGRQSFVSRKAMTPGHSGGHVRSDYRRGIDAWLCDLARLTDIGSPESISWRAARVHPVRRVRGVNHMHVWTRFDLAECDRPRSAAVGCPFRSLPRHLISARPTKPVVTVCRMKTLRAATSSTLTMRLPCDHECKVRATTRQLCRSKTRDPS
jgi:hypothetical protein